MTRLFNEPTAFAADAKAGFADAYSRWVAEVPGGVVRSTVDPQPTVAVITGGGSGHYPAFAGLVGPGLAHGAAMGNLFASPSTQQVLSVARLADRGRGVLLTYGNYAGDVLNFEAAKALLRDEGIESASVIVTDDISSAPPAEESKRRGIAGGLIVFKIAGAASARGLALSEVERLAAEANRRTRTLGVAFSGCTLPGADEPLFSVPDGRMAVGMGIHGEPGISEEPVPTADGLATLLVERLLEERPPGAGSRVVAILNGLGSVKYEELFVVYGAIAGRLRAAGLEIVEPEVGEFVTSFDMAGLSLSLFWPDDELESLWSQPARAPAFRKGEVAAGAPAQVLIQAEVAAAIEPVGDALRGATAAVEVALRAAAECVAANVDELGRLDAIAGDGDHGIGMQRGTVAALDAVGEVVAARGGPGTALTRAGAAWSDSAGGTSGALWGLMLQRAGARIGDGDPPTTATVVSAVEDAVDAVIERGGAVAGDKTMVDVLLPLRATFAAATAADDIRGLLRAATEATAKAALATADMVPRLGRARAHGAKSLGAPDPGALSLALIVAAISTAFDEESNGQERGAR